ncbi:hypothetical protein [Chitinophaga sp. sic0106]|uniref:hypothetical protein n=1 Tax=Chitinophaga sp. sic0106 TaxID=2854785 RepID=UPI001C446AD7|nr:hypothetical protein [Chitinophaga sp. sic0106]MBV7530482.1 hypothetical protein [Chitinophaga sp. sic0106]
MSTPAMVPMALDVLLINSVLKKTNQFRTWRFEYANLADDTFHDAEPEGFTDDVLDMKVGAWLHWTLPRSLRSGSLDNGSNFPLAPNRWLIVRIHRDTSGNNVANAWVQESDCPKGTADNASAIMVTKETVNYWRNSSDPKRNQRRPEAMSDDPANTSYYTHLGVQTPLSSWSEMAADYQFLHTVAPGNLDFSGYVPHNLGVFSFYDDLNGVPDQTTLSYFVCGWYANNPSDIIKVNGFTAGQSINDVLAALNWTIAKGDDPGSIDTTFYTGMSFGLAWKANDTNFPIPDELEDTRDTNNMTIAIANNSIDAFTTLVGTQLHNIPGYSNAADLVELLRAFQYDMLPYLNETDGDAAISQRLKKEWFDAKFAGTRWEVIADTTDNNQQNPTIALTPDETTWLVQLNNNQRQLDQELGKLYSLQWNLNSSWWKHGYLKADAQQFVNNIHLDDSDLAPFIDPNNADGDLRKVLAQLEVVNALLNQVPQPATTPGLSAEDAFNQGVTNFSNGHLGPGKILKAVNMPRYWHNSNPSVVISGVTPDPLADPETSLEIRLSTHIIDRIKLGGNTLSADSLGNIIPSINNFGAVPAAVQPLYKEFFLLDPANAALLAAKAGADKDQVSQEMKAHDSSIYTNGVLPDTDLAMWRQKWNPMYMEWQVMYVPVPFEWKDGTTYRNWTFNGTDYDMKPNPKGVSQQTIAQPPSFSGRSLLSPHTQFTFGARLQAFVNLYGDSEGPFSEINQAIQDTDNWRFLSQELVSFNEHLTQRDIRAYRRPSFEQFTYKNQQLTFAKVIGYPDTTSSPPYDTPTYGQGMVNSLPAVKIGGPSDYPFHAIRSGQFYFINLIIYDKFGRVLPYIRYGNDEGVHSYESFPLIVDEALSIKNKLSANIEAPFQLPPRLLQPARFNFDLVDYKNDNNLLNLAVDVNPVCGWVLSNHLDKSILVFLPDGTNAGEVALRYNSQGEQHPVWIAPPHNDITTIDLLTTASPQLGAFVKAIITKSGNEFHAFIGAIDTTLWTTDPLGNRTDQNLSLLIGRPLALVRTRLQFELDGLPIGPCDWPAPVRPVPPNANIPAFTSSPFSIRFGDLSSPADGVIGYFEETQYNQFNSVAVPASGQNYVQQIGPLQQADGNYVQLTFDGTTKYITLLMDPRASIHAFTGIFPVKELLLPNQFVDKPLSSMEITFTVGPLLTRIGANQNTDTVTIFPDGIDHLPIAEKNGSWSWWDRSVNADWKGYGLNISNEKAQMTPVPAMIREGVLQFVTNLSTDKN